MENWSKYNQEVTDALREDGTSAYIRKKTQAEYDITTGKKAVSKNNDYKVYVIFMNNTSFNEQIASDEILVICSHNNSLPLDGIAKNLWLVYEDKEYSIVRSKAVRPGGVILFHKLTCKD